MSYRNLLRPYLLLAGFYIFGCSDKVNLNPEFVPRNICEGRMIKRENGTQGHLFMLDYDGDKNLDEIIIVISDNIKDIRDVNGLPISRVYHWLKPSVRSSEVYVQGIVERVQFDLEQIAIFNDVCFRGSSNTYYL